MRIGQFFTKVGPALAMAAVAGLSGCNDVNVQFGENEGVPLAELDMAGDPPTGVALASSDSVTITAGDEFAIDVEGSDTARDRMRFALEDGTLGIHRSEDSWSDDDSADVSITMPAPGSLVLAGSGTIRTDAVSADPEIVIAGSGEVIANGVAANRLEVTIAGSGTLRASGTAEELELAVAGSGSGDLDRLVVGDAEVTVAGSGDTAFASDGTVDATIMGSGEIRVSGSARCTVSSMGSGRLICDEGTMETNE